MKFEVTKIKREEWANGILFLALFLLPWQTRWIFSELTLFGEVWEYGRLGIYAVEILIVLAAIILGRPKYEFCSRRLKGLSIMFLGAGLLSGSFSLNFSLAVGAMLHLTAAVILFLVLLDQRIDWPRPLLAWLGGLLLPCFLGWWQVLIGISPASSILGLAWHSASGLGQSVVETADGVRILRAYGSFSHPNIFGGYLALGTWLAVWWLWRLKASRTFWTYLIGGCLVLFLPTLVLTFSRSAWLALALGASAGSALLMARALKIPKLIWRFGGLAVLAALLTAVIFSGALMTRLAHEARLEIQSTAERAVEYDQALEVAAMNPLTGVGPGNYTLALAGLNPGQPAWHYQPSHNAIILAGAEIGLFGFSVMFWWLWQIGRAARQGRARSAALIGIAVLAPLILLDHYLWSSWSGLALVAIFLAIMARESLCRVPS